MLSKATFPLPSVRSSSILCLGVIFATAGISIDDLGITHTPTSADMGPYGATGSGGAEVSLFDPLSGVPEGRAAHSSLKSGIL